MSNRQYVQIRFSSTVDAPVYSYHNDGEPVGETP